VAEAAQQELRLPFKVPQSIFCEPDCFIGSSHLMVMISCVFNTEHGAV
jgi:hypothetical protein